MHFTGGSMILLLAFASKARVKGYVERSFIKQRRGIKRRRERRGNV